MLQSIEIYVNEIVVSFCGTNPAQIFTRFLSYIYIYVICDLTLKVGSKLLLHKLGCSILSRTILIGEITTHKFPKILFRYCQFHAWWRSSDEKIYYKTYKRDLSNI